MKDDGRRFVGSCGAQKVILVSFKFTPVIIFRTRHSAEEEFQYSNSEESDSHSKSCSRDRVGADQKDGKNGHLMFR